MFSSAHFVGIGESGSYRDAGAGRRQDARSPCACVGKMRCLTYPDWSVPSSLFRVVPCHIAFSEHCWEHRSE